jgi:hypothetical protein
MTFSNPGNTVLGLCISGRFKPWEIVTPMFDFCLIIQALTISVELLSDFNLEKDVGQVQVEATYLTARSISLCSTS